MNESGMHDMEY